MSRRIAQSGRRYSVQRLRLCCDLLQWIYKVLCLLLELKRVSEVVPLIIPRPLNNEEAVETRPLGSSGILHTRISQFR